MQRAAFPELQGRPRPRRHRRKDKRDRVLTGLKLATFVAAAGLLGVLVLLATTGLQSQSADRSPSVPKFTPGDDGPNYQPVPTTTTIDPPALNTDSAAIVGQPTTTTTPRPPRTSSKPPQHQPPPIQFAVIGQRCNSPGAFSVTKDYQPVVCYRRFPGDDPRWFPFF
jgi:hypothetical protein